MDHEHYPTTRTSFYRGGYCRILTSVTGWRWVYVATKMLCICMHSNNVFFMKFEGPTLIILWIQKLVGGDQPKLVM